MTKIKIPYPFYFMNIQDFCYENDPDRLEMIDVFNMCVTVIAYAPDSFRTLQMLVRCCHYIGPRIGVVIVYR